MPTMSYIHRRGSTMGTSMGPGVFAGGAQGKKGGRRDSHRKSVDMQDENVFKGKVHVAFPGKAGIKAKTFGGGTSGSITQKRRLSSVNAANQRPILDDVSNKYKNQAAFRRTKRLRKSNTIEESEPTQVNTDGVTLASRPKIFQDKSSRTVQIAEVAPMVGAGGRRVSKAGHYLPRLSISKNNKEKNKSQQLESSWDLKELAHSIDNVLSEPPEGVTDIDSRNNDPLTCPEYAADVINYLMSLEPKFRIPPHFLKNDPEVNNKMRAVLVDWLIQVQWHLHLLPETLHLTIAMIDLFIVKKRIALTKLQLLGITCVLIASKFEERFSPQVNKLIHLTDNTYKYPEVIKMELLVLRVLKFELFIPTPCIFVDRLLKVVGAEQTKLDHLVRYILDLSLSDPGITHYPPSLKAASAMCFSRKILLSTSCDDGPAGVEEAWTIDLRHYSKYSEEDLQKCMARYAKLLLRAEQSKFQGARDKYSSKHEFDAISLWPELATSYVVKETAAGDTV